MDIDCFIIIGDYKMPPKREASTSTFDCEPFSQATLLVVALSSSSKNIFQVVSRYNTLLATLSTLQDEEARSLVRSELQLLYNENYSNLQRLKDLENQNRDSIFLTARLIAERNECIPRKSSIWSNIRWHFNDKNKKSTPSFLIMLGLTTAIIATVFGLATIPLLYTAAFFLPIIMLSLGFIGLVTGIVTVLFDKKESAEKFCQLNSKLTDIETENVQRHQEQVSLDFTPKREKKGGDSKTLPSSQEGKRDVSCEFFTWELGGSGIRRTKCISEQHSAMPSL